MTRIGTSRLGFGCAHIPGTLSRRESEALLETALDHGVRHFDVARMYDDGRAEAVLGALARRRRDEMVIVTKAGIEPPNAARRAARALGLGVGARFHAFSSKRIRASVEASLRELGVERVDALLLHECQPEHVTDDLKRTLEDIKQQGKTGAIGIATSAAHSAAMIERHPNLCEVVQTHADAAIAPPPGARTITHSVLGARLKRLQQALAKRAAKERDSVSAAAMPTDMPSIAALLLRAALENADVVLFATSNQEHLRGNIAAMAQPQRQDATIAAYLRLINQEQQELNAQSDAHYA